MYYLLLIYFIFLTNINPTFGSSFALPDNLCNTMWYSRIKESLLKIIPSGSVVLADEGIILSCFFNDVHENNVTWFYNGKRVKNNSCDNLSCEIKNSGSIEIIKPNNYQQLAIEKENNQHEYYCSRASTAGVLRSPSVFLKIPDISDRIDVSPGKISAYENGLVRFYCNVFSYPSANITWWHNDTFIETNKSSAKYIMGQSGELYINSIQQIDSGFYKCKASNIFINHDDKVSNPGQLKVLSLSSGDEKISTKNITSYTEIKNLYEVSIGERLKIICGASGYFPANVSWVVFNSSGQHELTNSQSISVLEFKNINTFHTGDYYCSTQDQKMFHHIQIKVGIPPFSVNQHSNYILKKNTKLEFKCQVEGEPKPTITWFKNLKEIKPNDSRFTVTEDPSVFRINDIDSQDTGEYQCVAKNIHGEYWDAGYFEFDNMRGTKYTPQLAACSVISSDAINVSWVASEALQNKKYNNYAVEYWKTDDSGKNALVKVTQETFMNIEGLKKYINYSFYIRSWGAHRCSLPSNTVTCKISDHYDVYIKKENETTERISIANNDELTTKENHTSDSPTLGIVIGISISVIFIGITIGYVCYLKKRLSTHDELSINSNETLRNNETETAEVFQNVSPCGFPHSLGIINEQFEM